MIERIREEARQAFAELGYPTKQNEDWRFTSVAPIARTTFIPSAALVSLAGSVPKGVQVSKLSEAPEELVEPHLARYADYRSQAFVALNTANFQDGIFIHIPKGAVVEAPIELIFRSSGNGRPTASYPRILIVAEEASQATIIETYTGQV